MTASLGPGEDTALPFTQTDDEVIINVPLGDVHKNKIKCTFKQKHLKIVIDGEVKFDDELLGKIDVDESCWSVENDKAGRICAVSLVKVRKALIVEIL
jgi:hypothetical protein